MSHAGAGEISSAQVRLFVKLPDLERLQHDLGERFRSECGASPLALRRRNAPGCSSAEPSRHRQATHTPCEPAPSPTSVIGRFLRHSGGGELAQFVVDQRKELFSGARVAVFYCVQDPGDVGHITDCNARRSESHSTPCPAVNVASTQPYFGNVIKRPVFGTQGSTSPAGILRRRRNPFTPWSESIHVGCYSARRR